MGLGRDDTDTSDRDRITAVQLVQRIHCSSLKRYSNYTCSLAPSGPRPLGLGLASTVHSCSAVRALCSGVPVHVTSPVPCCVLKSQV